MFFFQLVLLAPQMQNSVFAVFVCLAFVLEVHFSPNCKENVDASDGDSVSFSHLILFAVVEGELSICLFEFL